MEGMTDGMKALVYKTGSDTASMKIITIVTLFFLPGTFIAVRYFTTFDLYSSNRCSTCFPKFFMLLVSHLSTEVQLSLYHRH